MLEKLKQRWHLESNFQIVVVFIVFAITGFSVLYAKKLIYSFIGVDPEWAWYIRFPIWVITIFPTYYLLLVSYGILFGQKEFFLWFTKKSFSRLRRSNNDTSTNSEVD